MIIKGSNFIIRDIRNDELEDVLEVYRNCEDFLSLGPVPKASMQMVLADINLSKEEGGTFCGIFQENKMIGIIDFVPSNFNGVGKNAFISLLMISKCHRRKGLGKDVVGLVENVILENADIEAILSGVQVNNVEAIRFWNSLGYKIVSEAKLLPDGTTVYDLRKDTTLKTKKCL